jgi:phosphoribosylamine--glycine ligase
MIQAPLTPILWSAATGVLRSSELPMSAEPHVGVVLAAEGYPGPVKTGQRIEGVEDVADALVFYAGVKEQNGGLATSGGRVMTVVGKGATFQDAIDRAYAGVSRIRFEGMQFRRDIGQRALVRS